MDVCSVSPFATLLWRPGQAQRDSYIQQSARTKSEQAPSTRAEVPVLSRQFAALGTYNLAGVSGRRESLTTLSYFKIFFSFQLRSGRYSAIPLSRLTLANQLPSTTCLLHAVVRFDRRPLTRPQHLKFSRQVGVLEAASVHGGCTSTSSCSSKFQLQFQAARVEHVPR